jgi:hypothetical protein
VKREAYERQKGICSHCTGENKKKKWEIEEMEADHIKPWHENEKQVLSIAKCYAKKTTEENQENNHQAVTKACYKRGREVLGQCSSLIKR